MRALAASYDLWTVIAIASEDVHAAEVGVGYGDFRFVDGAEGALFLEAMAQFNW